MNQEGCDPNRSSLISCLNSCGNLSKWIEGKQIHTQVLKKLPPSDVIVGNVLIDFYSKCGKLSEAAQAFDEIPIRDSVSWNSMLSGYSRNGRSGEAWKLFSTMKIQGMEFSHQTFSIAAKACGELKDIKEGEQLHCLVLKTGFESHVVVSSALLDMYVKLGYISWSRKVFNSMAETNVVSWTSIISGYVQIDEGAEALKLFKQQILVGVLPDAHSLSSILAACANIPALEFGKLIHACIMKLGYEFQIFAGNSLVAMYSRCGCLFDAQRTLDSMNLKDVITWTSIISGYAQHGQATKALEILKGNRCECREPASRIHPCV
ncbi:pentatricopeptide repeat-containing protein At2g33680-like isoform X2 [Telopea speciosissima]|uniref:pentatricopeptide repeat-containing protein At2g33680-like isoform X2 n=1 Tax=Telopea speciosissima TaxID=54955 RepID=UPI001CC76562|nr:pentatricopeptide repeat-containing protein At2g33680-like isoform X2 [Telopea speciosissima]